MKLLKSFGILMLAVMPAILSSCSSKEDLPDVEVTVTIKDVVKKDNVLYVVQGEPLIVEGLTVKPITGGAAALGPTAYYIDDFWIGTTDIIPFGAEIETANLNIGNHVLCIRPTVLQEGKTLAYGLIYYNMEIVKSKEDLPAEKAKISDVHNLSLVLNAPKELQK
ncbi:MAG: hypothetical protein HUK14_03620 [Muribaculaceae bacterium]|nr:hypothetical protein [Muribaculaceae bacterium]